MQMRGTKYSTTLAIVRICAVVLLSVAKAAATESAAPSMSPTNIFAPVSTPAKSIFGLSIFVLAVTAAIFTVVFALLVYTVVKFRKTATDNGREPPQVYGSNQVEIAWTVIPVLIVVALFMATARVIASVQKAVPDSNAIHVVAIGHQFWWEYRYPGLNVVTANELHVPVSDPEHPTPTFIKLLSADTDHSFWVPRLAGKTCGSTHKKQVSTWGSVRSIAEHNTPRCFCEFMFSHTRTSTAGFSSKSRLRSLLMLLPKGDGYSKIRPALTATPCLALWPTGASAPT